MELMATKSSCRFKIVLSAARWCATCTCRATMWTRRCCRTPRAANRSWWPGPRVLRWPPAKRRLRPTKYIHCTKVVDAHLRESIPSAIDASQDQAIRHVTSSRFTRTQNLDHVAALQAKVARDRIRRLDTRQLCFLQAANAEGKRSIILSKYDHQLHMNVLSPEQIALLLDGEQLVARHQLVLRDVDQQLRLKKCLELQLGQRLHNLWVDPLVSKSKGAPAMDII